MTNDEIRADIINLVKQFKGIIDSNSDTIIDLNCKTFMQWVLNYCNLTEYPIELIEVSAYEISKYINIPGVDSNLNKGTIKAITRGSYKEEYAVATVSITSATQVFNDFKPQLRAFRVLGVPV